MFKSLMTRRKFAPLFFCQFFAAFGDNFLKAALSFLVAAQITRRVNRGALITLAGAVFIAPFFFLSGLGGELADRYDKALMAQRIKFVEMGAAALAVIGFAFHSVILLFVALVPVRNARLAVRPGQIRHSARSSGALRIAGRQRVDRRRHVPRHSDRHHCRRHRRQRREQSDPFRLADGADRAGKLARQPADSANRRGRAQACDQSQHPRFDLGPHQGIAR